MNIVASLWVELLAGIKKFFITQAINPFETVIAFYCMYGGISGLLKLGIISDQFTTVLGETMSYIFNAGYALSGIALYLGIGLARKEVEVFGLILIITSLMVRIFAIGWLSGLDDRVVNLYVINVALITTCLVRLITLFGYNFAVIVVDTTKNKIVAEILK